MKRMLISAMVLLSLVACKDKSKTVFEEYTIKPNDRLLLYGMDVNRIMDSTFAQISKEIGEEIQVDREVSIIFIRKQKDFTGKTQKTYIEDGLELRYGPVEDLSLFKKYKEAIPNLLLITGTMNINEKKNIKEKILAELGQNLPKSDAAQKIIEQINSSFIVGEKKDVNVTIDFSIHSYPTAFFTIGYSQYHPNEIYYKYLFSKMKDPNY